MSSDLAVACRPTTLDAVWGNKEVVNVLKGLLKETKRPQTYLMTGPAGTGKTTLARVMANELHISPVDITEINASDHNGIDDMRNLIESLRFASFGENRAVILDEAHLLSASAQSSILKLLEEPPKGTYIFLCTTDPQKLSTAIKSRCIAIVTKPLSETELVRRLLAVADNWKIDVDEEVIESVAEASEGVPRVALKLLDKVKGLETKEAIKVLSDSSLLSDDLTPDIRSLCQGIVQNAPWSTISPILKKIKGIEVEGVRRQVLGYLNVVLLNKGNVHTAQCIGYFLDPFYDSGYAGLCYAVYCCVAK